MTAASLKNPGIKVWSDKSSWIVLPKNNRDRIVLYNCSMQRLNLIFAVFAVFAVPQKFQPKYQLLRVRKHHSGFTSYSPA